jgi:hypothetical protein
MCICNVYVYIILMLLLPKLSPKRERENNSFTAFSVGFSGQFSVD